MEFISIAKTDPMYGQSTSAVEQWPGFSEKNCFWSDGAKHIQDSNASNILLSSKYY